MEFELDWGSLLSTAGGSGIALALCKALITKTLRDLDSITKKLNQIMIELSAHNIKIQEIDKLHEMVRNHDRLIPKLEEKIENERQSRLYQFNSIRMQKGKN